ncbi:MAG TPA: hypothetical protein VF600_04165 [Abditibacteriaceae bacterium]
MLYFALLIAVAFYGVVYFLMSVMQPHLQRPTATLLWLRDLFLVVPDPTLMSFIKQAFLYVVAYLVLDFVISSVKRLFSRKSRRVSAKNLRTVVVQQGRSTSLVLATEDSLYDTA